MPVYQINKGINRSIEFKGLRAQYIGYLGGGLVLLLVLFATMYLLGAPVLLYLPVTAGLGTALFAGVYRMSARYGPHGLMKRSARRYLPGYLKFNSRKVFTRLNA